MATKYTNVLHMTFMNSQKTKRSIRLADPRTDLTEKEILAVMNDVAEKTFFGWRWDGMKPLSAKIVKTQTDQILEID